MGNFDKIKEALQYIDDHLDEQISFESIAEHFHFSAYYFHRMFAVVVGRTIAVYVRDRRLMQACIYLAQTDKSIIDICFDCGFNSAQAFSRTFANIYGVPPSEYRKQSFVPTIIPVDEMIMKFTNRLRGGIYLNPNIIKRDALIIAGVSGDGNNTYDVWNAFEKLNSENPLNKKLSSNGYEIRLYDGNSCTVHVGYAVSDDSVNSAYDIYKLPASKYASFDVYVANGYDSENSAMDEWLKTNQEGYSERLLDNAHYCVEYYDERFNGSESGSIVEIWIPIEKSLE